MIGVWDYTVILTYLSMLAGVLGMFMATTGHATLAVLLLMICGLLDLFDGPVARTKKNRTAEQKTFGIQIDSLNDLICFGVLPAMIGFSIRPEISPEKLVFLLFPLAGLVRLAWFNVQEQIRQQETEELRKYYTGVPITFSSVIVPGVYMIFRPILPELAFYILLVCVMAVLGVLYISRIKIPKPHKTGLIIFSLIGLAGFVYLIVLLSIGRLAL